MFLKVLSFYPMNWLPLKKKKKLKLNKNYIYIYIYFFFKEIKCKEREIGFERYASCLLFMRNKFIYGHVTQ